MQYSIVNYKTVKGNIDFRYEPEFWSPTCIEEEGLLTKINTIPLIGCTVFNNGRAFDSTEFSNDGDIFISKIGDVTQKRDYSSWEKISQKHFDELNAKYLRHNDILMTLTGDPPDVGKVQLIFNPPKEKLSWNQRVALLRLKKQNDVKFPEFLFAVLSSKYCRDHIERWAKGIRQRNVGNPAVLSMLIPVLPSLQSIITELVGKSFNLLEQSKSLYSQAEELLLSELGLVGWEPERALSFVKNFSESAAAERIDAEYFQPKYEEIVFAVEKYKGGFGSVGGQFKQNKKTFKKISDKEYHYVEIGDINISDGSMESTLLQGNELPVNAKIKLQINDVVISKVRPYRGAIGIVQNDDYVGSGAFTVLQENGSINKETLFVFLRSKPMLDFSLKFNTGTSYPTITDEDILNFPLPKIESKIQAQVKERITEMYQTKKLSKSLLEIAKRGVEMAIEKDESISETWIQNEVNKLKVAV